MKLIQENNTLYIVEGENKYKVSEESYKGFHHIINKAYLKFGGYLRYGIAYKDFASHGVDIPKRKQKLVEIRYNEAFLLPEKEEPVITSKAPRYKAGQSHVFIPHPTDTPSGVKGKHGYYDEKDGFFVEWLGPEVTVCIRKDGITYKQTVTEFINNSNK